MIPGFYDHGYSSLGLTNSVVGNFQGILVFNLSLE